MVKIGDKTCNFASLYRSPSLTKNEFENFIKKLRTYFGTQCKQKPIPNHSIWWYQNARLVPEWYKTFEGCKIDMATSEFSLCQTMKEPKHILSNSDCYTDLIFTSQINLVMHSGVHPW